MLKPLFCAALAALVLTPDPATAQDRTILARKAVDAYYKAHTGMPIWQDEADYAALLQALRGLEAHGLNPAHYHLAELEGSLRNDKAQRDWLATDAWFVAATHMLHGKLNPVSVEPDWTAAGRKRDLAPLLTEALANDTIADSFAQLAPTQPGYKALLAEYKRLSEKVDGAPAITIAPGPSLKPDATGPRVESLQARLIQLGFMTEAEATGSYDEATSNAVSAFQYQHELEMDGVAGPKTIAALNRGVEDLLTRLRVNLERWRWLPDDLGARHVRVNIPGFSVTGWKNGAVDRTHLAIVGRLYRKTPVFSGSIQYIIFNPWWETPPSLARADKLPMFKRDPAAVQRLGFQVLDKSGKQVSPSSINWSSISASSMPYRLRQKPGPMNALGQVKIMFPNPHNVYLHDTPDRDLFAQRQRAFSSGCVRTQDPLGLAAWLLEDTGGWDSTRIDEVVTDGKETRANLTARIPVHVLYFTAINEGDAGIRYLDDIYDRDQAVLDGLMAKAN